MASLNDLTVHVNYSIDSALQNALSSYQWYDLVWPTLPPKPTPPLSPTQRLASDIAQLIHDGRDVGAIKEALADIEKRRHDTVHYALRATLDLAKNGDAKARRFRLAYYDKQCHGTEIIEGIEFPDERQDNSKEDHKSRVFLDIIPEGTALPGVRFYNSMKSLREFLDEQKIIYLIDYIDAPWKQSLA